MRTLLKMLAVLAAMYIILALVERGVMLHSIHSWVQTHFGDLTGNDQAVGWLVAVAILALSRLIPWRRLMLVPITGSTKSLLVFAGICLVAAVVLRFNSRRILFDPSGHPRQSYIETVHGPVLQDASPGSTDPATGLLRKALTAEVLRAINIAAGIDNESMHHDTNQYFSASDGKYKIWFVEGSCETRNEDGYDDRGRKLLPATSELVDNCEKFWADAEEHRRMKAEAQSRRESIEQRREHRHDFKDIGIYTAAGRFTIIDGVTIAFERCEVLRHQTRIMFRLVTSGSDLQSNNPIRDRFEFSLLNSDGTETRPSGLHRVKGVIATVEQDNASLSPNPGESGYVVVEFPREREAGGFAIAINRAVAFANPAGHIVSFRPF